MTYQHNVTLNVANVVVGVYAGKPIYLRDVAEVQDGVDGTLSERPRKRDRIADGALDEPSGGRNRESVAGPEVVDGDDLVAGGEGEF